MNNMKGWLNLVWVSLGRIMFRTYLAVHVVFGFNELAPVHLPSVRLTGHDVSLRFMENLDGHADRHGVGPARKIKIQGLLSVRFH